jgi:hypothetical protein
MEEGLKGKLRKLTGLIEVVPIFLVHEAYKLASIVIEFLLEFYLP